MNLTIKKTVLLTVAICGMAAAKAVDIEFFRDLVAIPSASADIQQVNRATRAMKAYLEQRGVWCVIETHPSGSEILFAATKPGKVQDFILAPHIDVVPASVAGQYDMKILGDKVVGRGVSDCKGRAVSVAEVLVKLNGKVSVGCIFGTDEELGGAKTTWMVNEKGYRPRRMVIVADTGFGKVCYAQKGQLMVRMSLKGRGGHSSRPWLCDDSITKIVADYMKIREIWDKRHPLAEDKWSDVLTPTIVRSNGDALNRIPSEVEMNLNLRSVNPGAKDELIELIRTKTSCEAEIVRYSPPINVNPNDPLLQGVRIAMSEALGKEVAMERMVAATDARCFVDCGVPIAIVGTNGGNAHGDDEWSDLTSLDLQTKWLVAFLSDPDKYTAKAGARKVTVTAAGDAFMVQAFPAEYSVAPALKEWIGSGDARLVNFEAVVNDGTCRPAAWSGGTWSSMDPSVFPDLWKYGFNGCGCANNHSLDFGYDALFMTMKTLREAGKPFAGIGENLQEATKAAFIDTPKGKVAFISISSAFHPDAAAGWKTSRSPGRPGLNPLRWKETYLVTAKQLEWVKEIASDTGINGNRELDIRTGFTAPDAPGTFQMGKLAFKESDKPGRTSVCNANDIKRIVDAIAEARKTAVAVVILAHSHTMRYKDVEEPAPYFVEFCRKAIDSGADAVIGGGTHQLKGIEMRNGRPIFYSLGDFVFQNNVVPLVPPDFCEQYGVPLDSDAKTAFNARSKGGKVGLHAFRENFLSVVPKIEFEAGKPAVVTMLPIELHFGCDWSVNGLPRPADAEATKVIADTLKRLSDPLGTEVVLRGDGILEAKSK